MKSKNLLKYSLLFLVFLTGFKFTNAQTVDPEIFYQYKKVNHIATLPFKLPTILDDKYTAMNAGGSWRSQYKHFHVTDRITVQIEDTTARIDSFHYWLEIKVDTFKINGNHDSFYVWIPINYSPTSKVAYTDKFVFQFKGIHKYKLTLMSVKTDSASGGTLTFSAIKKSFSIRGEIQTERYYLYSYEDTVVSLTHTLTGNKLKIDWSIGSGGVGPLSYELEWTWLDTLGYASHLSNLDYDFLHNSTRIVTSQKTYTINTVYDGGVILYRVRRVRLDSVYLKYTKLGHWLPVKADKGNVSGWKTGCSNYVFIKSHENQQKNWDYSMAFAENGLKKEVVNYFDGSLRRRQGVTLINSNNYDIVDQSLYDWQGREAVKILPVPAGDDTLKFHHAFNLNMSSNPYEATDFDQSSAVEDLRTVSSAPLGTGSGAGQYYSSSNPTLTGSNAFIPDAQGYPFAQTVFKPDGTGRVMLQGGVGFVHRIGGGHETHMLYGKPSQNILDQLFGHEAGYWAHYKRNAVIDPNGQASVSYVDQHGRVVATSLGGEVPTNLDTIASFQAGSQEMQKITRQDNFLSRQNNSLVVNYPFTVINAGYHSFAYKLHSPGYLFGCIGSQVCLTCKYDLTLNLINEFGETIFSLKRKMVKLTDTGCGFSQKIQAADFPTVLAGYTTSVGADSIKILLPVGEYKLYKVLTVNTDGADSMIKRVLDTASCYLKYSDFLTEELAQIDTNCHQCDTCAEAMGICEGLKEMMLEDMTPGGQYADFAIDSATGTFSSSIDSTSIFYVHSGAAMVYKRPATNAYKDNEGNISKIKLADSTVELYPQQLSVDQFVRYWQPSWAEALLPYHPEYCMLALCGDSLYKGYNYDEWFTYYDTYDSAFKKGLMDPLAIHPRFPDNKDSFLHNAGTRNAWGDLVKSWCEHYSKHVAVRDGFKLAGIKADLSIWQMAAGIAFCSESTDEKEIASCFVAYSDTTVLNKLFNEKEKRDLYWLAFRGLYLSLKQDIYAASRNAKMSTCSTGIKNVGTSHCRAAYRYKHTWFPKLENYVDTSRTAANLSSIKNAVNDSFKAQTICESQIEYWKEKLKNCTNWVAHEDSIIIGFLEVCNQSMNPQTPEFLPSSSLPFGFTTSPNHFNSFDDVLKHFLGGSYKSIACNTDLLSFPLETGHSMVFAKNVQQVNDCHCNSLKNEIKQYNGCFDDSTRVTSKGAYMLKFFKDMKAAGAVAIIQHKYTNEGDYAGIREHLFKNDLNLTDPVNDSVFIETSSANGSATSNEFYVNISYEPYNHSSGNGRKCNLFLNLPAGKVISDIQSFLSILPYKGDTFELRTYFGSSDTEMIKVTSTCFAGLFQKCDAKINFSDVSGFLNYYNNKYASEITNNGMIGLLKRCNSYGEDGFCSPTVKEKDKQMIAMLDELFRPTGYYNNNNAVHKIKLDRGCWHDTAVVGNALQTNYLLKNKKYKKYFFPQFHKYNDIWFEGVWRDPTTHQITNNHFNQDSFVGGNWIGIRCNVDPNHDSIKQCFIGYGDVFNELASSLDTNMNNISDVDSFANMHYDWDVEDYIVTAFNRTTGDSVHLSFNTCYTGCKPSRIIAKTYSETVNGISYTINYTYEQRREKAVNELFTYLANTDRTSGPPKESALTNAGRSPQSPYYNLTSLTNPKSRLLFVVPGSSGNSYITHSGYPRNEADSMLIGYIINPSDTTVKDSKCQITLRRIDGTLDSVHFGEMQYFKDFEIDKQRVKELVSKGNTNDVSYFFKIKGGKIVAGDTLWQQLRGWSTCYAFFTFEAIDGSGLYVDLPKGFADECKCLTCPELVELIDTLYSNYPALNVENANYQDIMTNLFNRKLQSNLSWADYQTFLDNCDAWSHHVMPANTCDYRVFIPNVSSCKTDVTSYLSQLNDSMDNLVLYNLLSWNSDSTEYCINLSRLSAESKTWFIHKMDSLIAASSHCGSAVYNSDYKTTKSLRVFVKSDSAGTEACSPSSFNTFNSAQASAFGVSIPAYKRTNARLYIAESNTFSPTLNNSFYEVNLANLTDNQLAEYMHAFDQWTNTCSITRYSTNFYYAISKTIYEGDTACIADSSSVKVCEDCEKIRKLLIGYQYSQGSMGPEAAVATWKEAEVEKWMKNHNYNANVFFENSNCITCSDKKVYVCSDPSKYAIAMYNILQRLQIDGNLGNYSSSSYESLSSDYIPDVNQILPAGVSYNSGVWGWRVWYSGRTLYGYLKLNSTYIIPIKMEYVLGNISSLTTVDGLGGIQPKPTDGASDILYINITKGKTADVLAITVPGSTMSQCCGFENMTLCPKGFTRNLPTVLAHCGDEFIPYAVSNAIMRYNSYRDSLLHHMRDTFVAHCFNNVNDTIRFNYRNQYYHYTLYFHDLAGNLMRTVPPDGVFPLTLSKLNKDSIDKYRPIDRKSGRVYTAHKMGSFYNFNSLNAPVWQKTPDGGESHFYYDRLGRLVASQNAKQKAYGTKISTNIYSYTVYDKLGRIREVGEVKCSTAFKVDSVQYDNIEMSLTNSCYSRWLAIGTRTQITRTYYDDSINTRVNDMFPNSDGQQNLRNRVATMAYFETNVTHYNRATHFSYDIHGNVHTLLQEYPDLKLVWNDVKTVQYDYELFSGKVKSVAYQTGKGDQFFHRYSYDGDNRLTMTETSHDNVIWDRDAEYNYYRHGPLSRTVLGEHAVQGMDYAYTIHGWIKAVNGNILRATHDMGKDGDSGTLDVARDAFGFSLGFYSDDSTSAGSFEGDYESIGTSSFIASEKRSPLYNIGRNLYNGNIKHMVTAISQFMKSNAAPQATVYKYDQLNRIKSMKTYASINFTTNAWNNGSLSDNYENKFTYDGNGNILTQYRKTAASTDKLQDDLTYHYQSETNKLLYVTDAVSAASYVGDIDNEASGNYTYDEIGNLVKDKAEGIDTIIWNVYGKIKEIRRVDTSSRPWLAFEYNAAGNRAVKIVKTDHTDSRSWTYTYYVHDASGNVLSVYTRKDYLDNQGDSTYGLINDWIYTNPGLSSLQNFFKAKFTNSSAAMTDWKAYLAANEPTLHNLDNFDPDDFLTWDNSMAPNVLHQFWASTSANNTENDNLLTAILSNKLSSFVHAIIYSGISDETNAINAILANDPTDLLLNYIGTHNLTNLNTIWSNIGGIGTPPALLSIKITFIRTHANTAIATQICNVVSTSNLESYVLASISTTIMYNSWNSSQSTFPISASFEDWHSGGSAADIADVLINHYSNSSHLLIMVKEANTAAALFDLAGTNNFNTLIDNTITSSSYTYLANVLYNSSGMTLPYYLGLVKNYLGNTDYHTMLAAIGANIKYRRDLLLAEQHIYGSARHGMYTPNQLLAKYHFSISDSLDIALDSFKFVQSNIRFMRTVTLKQYELSNHLGNVLTTVYDRRTPIAVVGGTAIKYFEADVIFATDYYPFGSGMGYTKVGGTQAGREFSYENYRFGFNGKEKLGEGAVENYDFGARVYDGRLGRFLSEDRHTYNSPEYSPYNAFINNPIIYSDPTGNDEFLTIKIQDNRTGVTTTKMDREKISDKYLEQKFNGHDISGSTTKEHNYYDIHHIVTIIINKDGSTEMTGTTVRSEKVIYHTCDPLDLPYPSLLRELSGDEGSQPGGINVSSEDGGISPTKKVSKSPTETIEVRAMLIMMGLREVDLPLGTSIAENISGVTESVVDIVHDNKKASAEEAQAAEQKKKDLADRSCTEQTCPNPECRYHDPVVVLKDALQTVELGYRRMSPHTSGKWPHGTDYNGPSETVKVPCASKK